MELTNKLQLLKERLFNVEYNDPGIWHFTDVNILDSNPEFVNEAMVVRKAKAMEHICLNLPAIIKKDELIVGNPNQNSVGWGTTMPKYYTEEEGKIAEMHQLNEASVWGHHPPQFNKIIDLGIAGVKAEINEAIEKQLKSNNPDKEALNEYRAMIISLDGVVQFAKRHSEEALKEALKCEDPIRRKELFEIYEVCNRVPLNPATSFQEALQSFWFTYCIVNSGGEYIPFGRLDQYVNKYYEEDIKNNKITKEKAYELVGSLLIKCNERIILDTRLAENHYNFGLFSQGVTPEEFESVNSTGGYSIRALTWQENEDLNSDANFNYGQSGNDWLMNCIVGGLKPDGTDGTNDVSYMIVELMNKMDLLMPTLGARIHKNTPEAFLELMARVLRYGQGEPMIYNDDAIIPGFVDLGIPVEDARDYSNDGCWEVLVQGKSHFSYAHIMNIRCLEWVLTRGVSLNNNEQEGLDTGNPLKFKNYEELYQAYIKQVNNRIDWQCQRRIHNFGLSYMIAPDPLISSIMDNCIETGKDLAQNGAKYNFHLILATGMTNTVNALAAIKKLVYEEKTVELSTLIDAIKNNWEGYEQLRARVMNTVPKFGNDDDYVDELASRALKDFEAHVTTWREKNDKILFPCGVGTFENYAALGRDVGASVDGRLFGEALAPNYSPFPGTDINGPTATIKSFTKPDLLRYFCGCPIDLSVNSNEFEGEVGVERMKAVIKSFCELGGQIGTITSTNVEDLKDAKVNPEKHKSLRVRMGGLSAYFVSMSPVQQDNIIKRFSR